MPSCHQMSSSNLLLLSRNILINPLSIISNSIFPIIINRNSNSMRTTRLITTIMKLTDIPMLQSLFNSNSLLGIKLQHFSYQIQSIITSSRKKSMIRFWPSWRQRIQHRTSQITLNRNNIAISRPTCKF